MLKVFNPKNYKLYLKSFLFALGTYVLFDSFILDNFKINEEKGFNDTLRNFNEAAFESVIDDYDEYVREAASIIDANSSDNVFAIYATYLSMQNKGYLSYGNSFNPDGDKSDIQVFSHLGINVALGNGVCRHQSDNLYRIFKELGYDCERVTGEGYVSDGQQNVTNHQVLYIYENGEIYLLDPANNTIFVRCGKEGYVSIMDPNFKFEPRLSTDMTYNYDNANYWVYFNSEDRTEDLDMLRRNLELYVNMANELGGVFMSEEATRLYALEKEMYDAMEEYRELVEEIEQKKLEKGLQ